jgi:hypothetical protein
MRFGSLLSVQITEARGSVVPGKQALSLSIAALSQKRYFVGVPLARLLSWYILYSSVSLFITKMFKIYPCGQLVAS